MSVMTTEAGGRQQDGKEGDDSVIGSGAELWRQAAGQEDNGGIGV